jgi:signal transduction histidine kinase
MDRPLCLGLCGREDSALLADLQRLPGKVTTRAFDSIYSAIASLASFEPDAVFVLTSSGDVPEELAGAIRALLALRPQCAVVIVAARERELSFAPICQRTRAHLLLEPYGPAQLLATLDQALSLSDRPRTEAFLDLVHGVADEINNPLMFLMGHLQLLQLQLDPQRDRDALEQISAALGGAQRIHETTERMRRIEAAAAGPRRANPFDLWAELSSALREHRGKGDSIAIVREPSDGAFAVAGDAEILRAALASVVALAFEFRDGGNEAHFVITRIEAGIRVRLSLRGPALADWSMPRTYEPYYLCRALRGSTLGLSLFHVQAAAHGHRGRATARRLPDGAVAIDIELPLR